MMNMKMRGAKLLEKISLGKYETDLYNGRTGTNYTSSALEGLVTIPLVLVLAIAAGIQLALFVRKSNYNI